MTVAFRKTLALIFLGLMALAVGGCNGDRKRDPVPVFTQQPGSLTLDEGATATFNVVVSPSTASVQWQRNGANIAGATGTTYSLANVATTDTAAQFTAVATTGGGSATSSTATLTVRQRAPSITTPPASATVGEGATATFTVAASGSGLTYQWQKDGANVPGATAATYTTPAAAVGDGGSEFRVIVTNGAGSVTSASATLTVIALPVITTPPANASVTTGDTATFTVSATGTGLAYQWQRGTTDIAGATSASYTTPATTLADDGTTFRVIVTNLAGSATSTAATLAVAAPAPAANFRTTPMVSDYATGGVALKSDGTVWAWGYGVNGENGNGLQTLDVSPVQVQKGVGVPLTNIVKISAGATHVLALDDQGNVWTWGTSASLGSRPTSGGTTAALAERVLADATGTTFLANVTDVAAGRNVSYAALADGTVVAWGRKQSGSMGDGTATTAAASVQAFPLPVPGIGGIVEVSAGDLRGFARTADGTIYGWGAGAAGALGNGSFGNQPSPVAVTGLSSAVRVAANDELTLAILADGTARLWGAHNYVNAPACGSPVAGLAVPTGISLPSGGTASTFATVAPFVEGSAFVYGGALYQTGDPVGDGVDQGCSTGALLQAAGLANLVGVARSFGHFTHVWTSDGRVLAAGTNALAQLGIGNQTAVTGFVEIPNLNLLGSTNPGTQVFYTDFESGLPQQIDAGTAASIAGVQQFAGVGVAGNQFGGSFLRSETANTVTLTLTNLPAHSALSVQFLFAAIDSLDGAGTFPAGDYFVVSVDGRDFFREAFSNATPTQVQTYLPPPGVELARRVDLGFSGPGSFYTDSAYDFGQDPQFLRIPHTASSVTITFKFDVLAAQGLSDESWGMDNLKISVVP